MSSLRKKTPKISVAGDTEGVLFTLGETAQKIVSALPQNLLPTSAGPKAMGEVDSSPVK